MSGFKKSALICVICVICGQFLLSSFTWKSAPEKVKINDRLSFIYQQDETSALTVIYLAVKGGTRAEPVSQRGLAFLTARLAVEMPTFESLRDFMQLGSRVFYHVEGDYVAIWVESLSDHLAESLKIVTGIMKKPLFSGLRIDRGKDYLEHRRKGEADSPEQSMESTLGKAFFPAYAGSVFGAPDTLKNIKKKDLDAFYDRGFNHANMVIAVVTDLSKVAVVPVIAKYFDSFPPGKPYEVVPLRTPHAWPGEKEFFLKKENRQVLISLGARLPAASRENFALVYMLDNLLGKGIGSKLWSLRAQKDLAYSLNSRFIQWKEGGFLTVFIKTGEAKKTEAQKALKDLITGLCRQGITAEELAGARGRSQADFLRDNETKTSRARQLAYFEALGLGFDFWVDFFPRVEQVTLEEFNGFLNEVLNPEHLVEVVIGPG